MNELSLYFDWWPGEETGTLIIIAVRLSYLQAIEPLMKNLDSALIYLYGDSALIYLYARGRNWHTDHYCREVELPASHRTTNEKSRFRLDLFICIKL